KPPPLDTDLEAFNQIPKYRPLVLAPSNNRLSGLFQSATRYVEPSAEQLNLDETELTGFCFSFRDYVTDRVQRVCDRQSDAVHAARQLGGRAAESAMQLSHVSHLVKQEREGAMALKSLQRQAEKAYEMMQEILGDIERLEAALPASTRFFGSESQASKEFPHLRRVLGQRRRSLQPIASPTSTISMRRQIASRKGPIPAFPGRATSLSPSQSHGELPRVQRSQTAGLVHRSSALSPAGRAHGKYVPDALSLRKRMSRTSLASSEVGNASSRSNSPGPQARSRISYDGSYSPAIAARSIGGNGEGSAD
ncbi:hypothetical protein EC988_007158, partial [Linderina pennispora]